VDPQSEIQALITEHTKEVIDCAIETIEREAGRAIYDEAEDVQKFAAKVILVLQAMKAFE
jgi:hypothetical protein